MRPTVLSYLPSHTRVTAQQRHSSSPAPQQLLHTFQRDRILVYQHTMTGHNTGVMQGAALLLVLLVLHSCPTDAVPARIANRMVPSWWQYGAGAGSTCWWQYGELVVRWL
ncbi:hypothetical protein FHG87_016125 [Trinorchestia longiramus]|nr:hypothetical protein FHG87_016125 [Trinorchestia longiramus]